MINWMGSYRTSPLSKTKTMKIAANVCQRVHAKRHVRNGKDYGGSQSENEKPGLPRNYEKVHALKGENERDE